MAGLPTKIGDISQKSARGAVRITNDGGNPTFTASFVDFTPAANPSDVFALFLTSQDFVAYVKHIEIWATADAPASVSLLLQRSTDGGGGTRSAAPVAKHDINDWQQSAQFYAHSVNRADAQGNGISDARPVIKSANLKVGTTGEPGERITWDFTQFGHGILCRSLLHWVVLNLQKQSLPAGFKISCSITWSEDRLPKVCLAGSSSIDYRAKGLTLWTELLRLPGCNSALDLRNHGTNGTTLDNYLNNTGGVFFSLSGTISTIPTVSDPGRPHKVVMNFGANDVRAGATTLVQLIARLESFIATLLIQRPDTQIVLWGPHAFTSDDYGGFGYVTATGIYAGMSLAQAAQTASDILYAAYESFRNDSRLFAVVQKQDLFGRESLPGAQSPYMEDQLHQNPRGQVLSSRQIAKYIVQ